MAKDRHTLKAPACGETFSLNRGQKVKKVSVIIPTFNRADYLPYAIRSVMRQTMQDCEIIVVDDGSTDNTRQIVEDLGNGISYVYQPNGGCSTARNHGLRLATSPYIVFLDSDDLIAPRKFELESALLDGNLGAGFAYSDSIEFSATDYYYQPAICHADPRRFAVEHFLHPGVRLGSLMFRREMIERCGAFDSSMRYNEDSDLVQQIAILSDVVFSPYPSNLVRHHASNKSSNRAEITHALIYSAEKVLASYPEFAGRLGQKAVQGRMEELRRMRTLTADGARGNIHKLASFFLKIVTHVYVAKRRALGNVAFRRSQLLTVKQIMREMEDLLP